MEEQENLTTQETVLENANKWYAFWVKLPKIIFWVTVILFFIWGIVDPSVFYYEGWSDAWYGVMQCKTGFGAFMIWQLIGWASATLFYVSIKLALAPMIVQIETLKEINENIKNKNN